ncbi:hypothetical protein [Pseudomonas lopnurensis]|uniref:hypothetical protein n=1 Tax=Pseudomonas lopnurensis TaxID=1477517 RepID=UPI0028B07AD2|nr:hypothetical protein [Pseudomonas lopnurensis]
MRLEQAPLSERLAASLAVNGLLAEPAGQAAIAETPPELAETASRNRAKEKAP